MRYKDFIPHLEELRRRIILILVVFVAALFVCIAFVGRIYHLLLLPGVRLAILGPGDVVQIYLMLGGAAAFVVTTPFALWQLWSFMGPGLLPRERRYAFEMIAPVTIMFLLGISFSYFLIFPRIYRFLIQLAYANQIRPIVTADEYFSFMVNIVMPFGLLFEMPVLVVFLTRLGIISPSLLRKWRRYAYLACVIIGTLISPPELVSHLSVTIPMMLIYEISITLSGVAYRRKQKAEAWWRRDQVSGVGDGAASSDAVDGAGQGPQAPDRGGASQEDEREAQAPGEAADRRLAELQDAEPPFAKRPGIDVEERE